ncbi:MAG: dTDP-4-amino-4,6-dideoxygalactose transaminase [Chloroflexales bacterium]|nr:dTDP-4-amino-4,6-dideoxygalactose transaminase [Chloroflexales bacterium]
MKVPFNSPYMTGQELEYISQAFNLHKLSGNGDFTKRCQSMLQKQVGSHKVLLTHSCTAALEMASILCDLQPGDEVIMPSYTFVSTANAVVLRNAIPVFVDIRPDTLNIDETLIEAAITPRTKAISVVHYAGVSCEMDTIMDIAHRHNLFVIEDAAQGYESYYKGRPLGSIGHFAAMSFHETKNVISGEGGALFVNDQKYSELAEIIWEKGTDRSQFFRGIVDKYTWQHVGSSFLPSELIAAFLLAQLENGLTITQNRLATWDSYHAAFADLAKQEYLRSPVVPVECQHNAHMYYVILPTAHLRNELLEALKQLNIGAIFHYIPLHSSPAGMRFGRVHGRMDNTDSLSGRLLRMPMYNYIEDIKIQRVIESVTSLVKKY